MQNDKISILSTQKFNKNFANTKNSRRKCIEICENFERNWSNFICSFSWISFNENFDGNHIEDIGIWKFEFVG